MDQHFFLVRIAPPCTPDDHIKQAQHFSLFTCSESLLLAPGFRHSRVNFLRTRDFVIFQIHFPFAVTSCSPTPSRNSRNLFVFFCFLPTLIRRQTTRADHFVRISCSLMSNLLEFPSYRSLLLAHALAIFKTNEKRIVFVDFCVFWA